MDDPCKDGKGTVPGTSQTPKIIVPPPNGIQGAYESNVGPDGNPQGPVGEVSGTVDDDGTVPRDEFQKDNIIPPAATPPSQETNQAMKNEKERRAHQPTRLDGEKPSDRAGEPNSNCQTFCSTDCLPQCKKWNCPSCQLQAKPQAKPANENTNCGTFCAKGSPLSLIHI